MQQNNSSINTAANRAAYRESILAYHRRDAKALLKMPAGMALYAIPTDSKFVVDICGVAGLPYMYNVPKHLLNFSTHNCAWDVSGRWRVLDRKKFFSQLI